MKEPEDEKVVEPETEGEPEPAEEVEETKVEVDAKALKAISDSVAAKMKTDTADIVKQAVEATLAGIETVDKKAVADGGTKTSEMKASEMGTIKVKAYDPNGEDLGEIEVESKFAHESKEMRFLKAARALATNDFAVLQAYKEDALNVKAKTGYANETTDADGAVLVPYPDFETTVHDNLPKYGVSAAYATQRTVMGNQVKQIGLTTGLTFVSTAEAAVKTGSKLVLKSEVKSLAKFALIISATDELTEDSAVDFWGLVTREMARALAKLQDQITFTNLSTANGGTGIAHTSGVITQPVSGAGTTISWDDLLKAENAIEDGIDTSNYKWFMRKETWNRLITLKGTLNDHYIAGSLNIGFVPNQNTPVTPWGTPIVFTKVLDKTTTVANPGTEAVFGDLSYYTFYSKRGMVVTSLREATVKDSDGSDFNLATQDGTALRFVVRVLGFLNSQDASRFVILGVGTVS